MSNEAQGPLRFVNPVATVLILALLLFSLLIGIAPNVDTRIVQLGESMWPGYAAELRTDPVPPDCVLEELKQKAAACTATAPVPAPADPFAGQDPFAAPAPVPPAPDPFAAPDPFGAGAPAAGPSCAALENLAKRCEERHATYASIALRLTPEVRRFRGVELAASEIAQFPYQKQLLVLVVLLGALSTAAHRMHIGLRNPATLVEHRVSQVGQLAAHLFWLASCFEDWRVQQASTADLQNPEIPLLWTAGFALLALVNVFHLVKPPHFEQDFRPTVARLLMVTPLFVYLAVLSGLYFTFWEHHPSGMAIFLHKFIQIPTIYLGIGLYIWAGMLLSRTQVARLAFDALIPFELSPVVLGWLIIVLGAVPTAYSGASGIFVIAVGAVIFERMRAVGASPRHALAVTAMAGSLGVVLRPCLIVVLIAVLNNNSGVTSDPLFYWGLRVFFLTMTVTLVVYLAWYREWPTFPKLARTGEVLQGLRPLVPYVVLAVAVLLAYRWVAGVAVTEHTAMFVLPAVLIAMVAWDRIGAGRPDLPEPARGLLAGLTSGTGESSHHIGALLFVMMGSVGMGGVVERSDLMDLVPHDLGSRWIAMLVLVIAMILVGMALDALGAVILVTVTIAPLASTNGIDPVHFWIVVLVAFELGYLHPPVGLNILLARQVAGRDAEVERYPVETFAERYEHIIVPCTIMAISLVIVAYVPLFFY